MGLPEILSQALNTKSLILGARGRWNERRALLRYALEVALEHDKPSAALRAYNNLADLTATEDRYQEAEQYVKDGLALSRKIGNRFWEWTFLGFMYPLFALGKWDEALDGRHVLFEDWNRVRAAINQGFVACSTAIHVNRGEIDQARRVIDTFSELKTSADTQEQAEYAYGAATLFLAEGDAARALETAETGVKLAGNLAINHASVKECFVLAFEAAFTMNDFPKVSDLLARLDELPPAHRPQFLQAQAIRFRAKLADRAGDTDGVEPNFKAAVGLLREMAVPFWMAVTVLEYAEWLTKIGRRSDAESPLSEARAIFEGLKATPWLERVGRAYAPANRAGAVSR
jgi:tetratricopeptide (TPR) repeat protein